jgi:hypothetical protein
LTAGATIELNGAKWFSFHACFARIVRYPLWTLSIIAAITKLPAWQLPTLSFKITVYDLIIE